MGRAADLGGDREWLRQGAAATGTAADLGGDGERLRGEWWQTLAAIRSGGYSDGEGGGPAATGPGRAAIGRAAVLGGD
jgi:hypothetical protein